MLQISLLLEYFHKCRDHKCVCDSCFNRLLYAVNLSYSAGPRWMQRAHLCWNEGLSDLPVECRSGVLCVGQSQSKSHFPDLCSEKNVSGSLFMVSAQSRTKTSRQNSGESLKHQPLLCKNIKLMSNPPIIYHNSLDIFCTLTCENCMSLFKTFLWWFEQITFLRLPCQQINLKKALRI